MSRLAYSALVLFYFLAFYEAAAIDCFPQGGDGAAVQRAIDRQAAVLPAVPELQKARSFWLARFDEKRANAQKGDFEVVFFGDSITHNWESTGARVWAENFEQGPYRALNCGICGDRTENLLWRIENDQLAGRQPKVIVMMIGTNNTGHRNLEQEPPTDTILGIQTILERTKGRFPYAKIILHPIFPRGETKNDPMRIRNDLVNSVIYRYADGERVLWCDFNARLLTADGVLEKAMAPDLLHLSARGYEIWAEELKPFLDYALGRTSSLPKDSRTSAATVVGHELPRTTCPTIAWHWLKYGKIDEIRRMHQKRKEEYASGGYYDAIWIGDSITHFWEEWWTGGPIVFREKFGQYKIFNGAYGGDKVENVLWNIKYGGLLDNVTTRVVSLMIGTNNTWQDSAEDIVAGVRECLAVIREKQPQATIVLFGLLPREVAHKRGDRDYRRAAANADEIMPKQKRVNELLRPLADGQEIIFVDLVDKFTDAEGLPDVSLFCDGTHPNTAGYRMMADAVLPLYRRILGR